MNYCRAAEAANIQLKEISSHGAEAVHHLNGSKMGRAMKECKYCSRKHEGGMEKCPAYGKTCTKCSNQNHFRSACLKTVTTPRKVQPQKDMQRSKPEVHAVHKDLQPSSEDELWVLSFAEQVNAISSDKAEFMQPWKSGTKLLKCRWILEYPAILPCSYLVADAEIQNTMRKLFIYSKSKLRALGTVIVPVRNPRNNVEYTEE